MKLEGEGGWDTDLGSTVGGVCFFFIHFITFYFFH